MNLTSRSECHAVWPPVLSHSSEPRRRVSRVDGAGVADGDWGGLACSCGAGRCRRCLPLLGCSTPWLDLNGLHIQAKTVAASEFSTPSLWRWPRDAPLG